MRIAHVLTDVVLAGAERIVADLAIELAERGHELAVFALRDTPVPLRDRTICPYLHAHTIPCRPLGISARTPWRLPRLRAALQEFHPDLVHAHLFHPNLATRLLAPRGLPLVNTLHVNDRRPSRRCRFLLDRATLHRATVVTAVSDAVARFHADRLNRPLAEFPVIRNGIRPPPTLDATSRSEWRQRWNVPENSLLIGAVGRLAPQKGYDNFLRLVPDIARSLPPGRSAAVVILGEGPQRRELERLAAAAPPEIPVSLPGFHPDAAACIGAFDLFVMPSRFEGFGLTCAEAMAHGVPAIVEPVDSLPELIDNYPNGLALPFTPENAATIANFATRPRTAPYRPFTVKRMTDEVEALYRSIPTP